MEMVDLIKTKRDGGRLADEEIRWFIEHFASNDIGEDQAAALAMAIWFRGMEPDELNVWTQAMIDSGETLDLSGVGRPTVDKHSTGGVGDKVSLILVPLVAACGASVPQLSGRGLGHTGGTLDKLESISGWSPELSPSAMVAQLRDVGGVIAGATADIAPADRRMYSLRDITSTVDSIPLIASSIMSKKIAEGTDALVLDVKFGSGAFLREIDMAREAAETMVRIGNDHGVRTSALLTNMDTVLGRAAGNAVEVKEAIEVLDGGGPSDLVEITVALAREMVDLAGLDADPAAVLASGRAREVWDEMIAAQGGDLSAGLPEAEHRHTFNAPESGYVRRLDALAVGTCAWRLGAGRSRKEDPVSPVAGVICLKKPGERVSAGDPILELHTDDPQRFPTAEQALSTAVSIGPEPPTPRPLIQATIH